MLVLGFILKWILIILIMGFIGFAQKLSRLLKENLRDRKSNKFIMLLNFQKMFWKNQTLKLKRSLKWKGLIFGVLK